ncbi:MAG: alpha/beta hydrolase domain-containing protein, partial [Burkholderiales bacterium]
MRLKLLAAALLPVFMGSGAAQARITKLVVDPARSQSPTFEGRSFGSVGQYEKIRGTAYGELDPHDRRNRVIVDIELAPRNSRGMVEYSMDYFILKPIEYSKGNKKVMFDYNNRGGMRIGLLNGVAANNNPTTAADAGTGFLFNQGYTVVSNGWDAGADAADELKISLPIARNRDGSSITGPSYEYIVFDGAAASGRMTSPLAYPALNPADKTTALLTERKLLDDMPTPIAADGWNYNADGTAISLANGVAFKRSWIYEFTYTAKDPIVAAIGLAATRDFTSFLRNASKDDAGTPNPLRGSVQQVYTYSISQPSRTLNDHVYYGFNEDEKGKQVFDGILSHTGGGNGAGVNYRFAQAGRTERNRQNHLYPESPFPFAHWLLYDPLTGR